MTAFSRNSSFQPNFTLFSLPEIRILRISATLALAQQVFFPNQQVGKASQQAHALGVFL